MPEALKTGQKPCQCPRCKSNAVNDTAEAVASAALFSTDVEMEAMKTGRK